MRNYDYEQAALVEALASQLGAKMHPIDIDTLKRNALELTKRECVRAAKFDMFYRDIRISQNANNHLEELTLLRKLTNMELENE